MLADMSMARITHSMDRPSWLILTPSIDPKPIRSVEHLIVRLVFCYLMIKKTERPQHEKAKRIIRNIIRRLCPRMLEFLQRVGGALDTSTDEDSGTAQLPDNSDGQDGMNLRNGGEQQ